MRPKHRDARLPKRSRERPTSHVSDEGQGVLAQVFLRRSVNMLERVSSAASSDTLKSALAAPTDLGSVASLLSDMAPLDVDLSSIDPLAEAMARGTTVKQDLLKRAGGALTSTQAARALGLSRQAVDKRRNRRALLAVPTGSGDYLYPACQFTPDGVVPGFDALLQAFEIVNPWTQLSALLAPAPGLGGKSMLETLQAGEAERAMAAAASLGEQAA